jgi:ribosomal protein S18 acetylase RimI-like enzyme
MASTGPTATLAPLIRPAAAEEAGELAVLLATLGYPCDAEEAAVRLHALRLDPDQQLLVADLHGELVGLLGYDLMYHLPLGATSCRITALTVREHVQGRGIGRALLREAETRARASGAVRIELTSAAHRVAAHAFYRARGYGEQGLRLVKRLGDA